MGPGVVTPTMNHFREMVTEREAEPPRTTQAKETRVPPPPVLHRVTEAPVRREEGRATTPPATRHTAEERTVNRKKPEINQPPSAQESRIQNDSVPIRDVRPEIAQEPADTRVLISRDTVAESVQPRQEPIRSVVQTDSPAPVAVTTPQFPAPKRREQPDRPERHALVMKAEPQIRNREFPVTFAPAPHAQRAVIHNEIAAPGIHVTIGKVTVQATLPSAASIHAPARAATHSSPRLTLERYLNQRGGRP
jgi:hypothetical protein